MHSGICCSSTSFHIATTRKKAHQIYSTGQELDIVAMQVASAGEAQPQPTPVGNNTITAVQQQQLADNRAASAQPEVVVNVQQGATDAQEQVGTAQPQTETVVTVEVVRADTVLPQEVQTTAQQQVCLLLSATC